MNRIIHFLITVGLAGTGMAFTYRLGRTQERQEWNDSMPSVISSIKGTCAEQNDANLAEYKRGRESVERDAVGDLRKQLEELKAERAELEPYMRGENGKWLAVVEITQ